MSWQPHVPIQYVARSQWRWCFARSRGQRAGGAQSHLIAPRFRRRDHQDPEHVFWVSCAVIFEPLRGWGASMPFPRRSWPLVS